MRLLRISELRLNRMSTLKLAPARKSFQRKFLTVLGLGAFGCSCYSYGRFKLTPLDYPVMITRSCRLALTVLKIIYDFDQVKKMDNNAQELEMPHFHERTADLLFDMCCSNRGVYIKVGQHIGAMEYLLPFQYIDRFKALHSTAPRSTDNEIRSVIFEELGADIEEVFDEWDWTPLGAASLAQVHRAKLKGSDEYVAVKVQHAPVKHTAHLDLMLMEFGVLQAAHLVPEFKLAWLARITRQNLPRELNFLNEAQNTDKIRYLLSDLDYVKIPKINYSLSTSRLLIMEYMPGTQINNREELRRRDISVDKTVESVTHMYSLMIFKHGFIHCDPHPGNIHVNKSKSGEPEIVLLDHGLYETINDEFRYNYALLWTSLIKGDLKNIRLASRYLNVESLFPLLSAMVSGRSWNSVKKGLGRTKSVDKQEEELIQAEICDWIPEMTTVLENVPKELILILKTNDLLRGLESTLAVRPNASSFITMSSHCLRAMYKFDCINKSATWLTTLKFNISLISIWLLKLYLKCSTYPMDSTHDDVQTKEVRMMDFNHSFHVTKDV